MEDEEEEETKGICGQNMLCGANEGEGKERKTTFSSFSCFLATCR